MNVLELTHVGKSIGSRKIVEDLTTSVQEGEIFGFLGPNGAGKTTTIRMIVGLIHPSHGTIRIAGHDIQTERKKALHVVGTIVENPETYGYLTVWKNLVHYARLAGIQNRNERIAEVVDIVDLKDRIHDKVRKYSLGMRQRLGLAQALLAHPKLLVLDEPTNGLDPAGMREFRELVRRLASEGMSVFVSSHLLSELEQMCDKVAIIKSGRIIAEQSMASLTSGSKNRIHMTVNDVTQAMACLQLLELCVTSSEENHLTVQAESKQVPEMIRSLVASNIDIFAVEPIKESLETTFLDLTGESACQVATEKNLIGGFNHA